MASGRASSQVQVWLDKPAHTETDEFISHYTSRPELLEWLRLKL